MISRAATWQPVAPSRAWFAFGLLLRPLQWGLAFPSVLYLTAMTIFLFRPPDLDLYHADRIALGILVFFAILRSLALREKLPFVAGVSLPMLGLVTLAVVRALREPFDAQTWSLVASKFVVPLVLFHLASLTFRGASPLRSFEMFVILALAYLTFIAIAFLADAPSLIFPRFILDESVGIHADRARGPFLQAVANGMSLNILGILAIVLAPQRRIVLLLWMALPFAVLATMTRAVWIAFAVSAIALGFRLGVPRIRRACLALVVVGALSGAALYFTDNSLASALRERTAEQGPVDARIAVYEAGWSMFQERPLTGWTAGGMYEELARRMSGYHLRVFFVHNTYLSLLIEFGIPGLLFYAILFFNLLRLGRTLSAVKEGPTLAKLRRAWPILLCVYLFNAFFVDMAYQFVIGLLFTVAGILQASSESAT
ncbi:MAG TPA: O-antigen ligase family protein [Terriglobales bacterium]|jgi:putative inorganic carbon (HCO3(-)) transporter|nr:O-antigen ligase family protein [Terriglobales bacterium]